MSNKRKKICKLCMFKEWNKFDGRICEMRSLISTDKITFEKCDVLVNSHQGEWYKINGELCYVDSSTSLTNLDNTQQPLCDVIWENFEMQRFTTDKFNALLVEFGYGVKL